MSVLVGSGSSVTASAAGGVARAARDAAADLHGHRCDLAIAFVAGELATALDAVLEVVKAELAPVELVGCTASGVLVGGEELTTGPAVVVWAIALGDDARVEVHELRVESVEIESTLRGLPPAEGPERTSAVLMLADASVLPVEVTLQAIEQRLPGVPVIGGMTSLIPQPHASLRHYGSDRELAGLALQFRGVDVLPCVSQGARPIGPALTVTAGAYGAIHELDDKPAIEALQQAVKELPAEEQRQVRHGLLIGVAVGSEPDDVTSNGYIVRGLAGADPSSGAVAIGASVDVGQTVRIHVRDPKTASDDLVAALRLRRQAARSGRIAGALAFTCNGRGREMFGADDHDAEAIQHELGPLPLAGMVSAGEIGPVGGRPFAHSFTATVAVFVAATDSYGP